MDSKYLFGDIDIFMICAVLLLYEVKDDSRWVAFTLSLKQYYFLLVGRKIGLGRTVGCVFPRPPVFLFNRISITTIQHKNLIIKTKKKKKKLCEGPFLL